MALAASNEGHDVYPAIEKAFRTEVCLPNGTWRTTYPHRLDDVNDWLLGYLPAGRCLQAMDVAVSSGISTLEWAEQLSANGIEHHLVAGDLLTDGRLVGWPGRVSVLLDDRGSPLLLEIGSIARPVQLDRWRARAVRSLLAPLLWAGRARGRRVSLLLPELSSRPEIEVVQDDITIPDRFQSKFDVVRAANLVQPSYFDEETRRRVIANLRDRLCEGGVLLICRTAEDGVNHATVFRRAGERLLAEASINGGAEVVDLALSI